MSVDLKASAQNQFEIDEAPIQETQVTEKKLFHSSFASLPEHRPVRDERARGVLWHSAALHRGTEDSNDAHEAVWKHSAWGARVAQPAREREHDHKLKKPQSGRGD